MTKEYGGVPVLSQLHLTIGLMAMHILGAPHRTAAASVAAELGMSAPDPEEFARQHALCSSMNGHRTVPAVAEALLVLGHAESSLQFTGELVRTRACPGTPTIRLVWSCARTCGAGGCPPHKKKYLCRFTKKVVDYTHMDRST